MNQRVFVILANQHSDLTLRGTTKDSRIATLAAEQAPILSELSQVGATHVHAYRIINAVSATVSAAEAARLTANPSVRAVVPDATIYGPKLSHESVRRNASPNSALPPCTFRAELDPQALQLTNTAFFSPTIPQAQSIVTGTGVTVAFIADGLDPNNPDFIRPDGTPVFVDYQDFSGDGPSAPTPGGEAFGDASSIAAQGNETYNVNDFVNFAHRQPVACPQIKVLGVAPGASLMGLKAFGVNNISFNSNFVQAIEYAVANGANVINESFGANLFPDTNNDPITLADDAAVAAGVTVVASTGDAGTAGTIGSPGTDPNIIVAGATTQFRLYSQVVDAGFQLGSGGWLDNNISSFSSGGIAQNSLKTPDVVAPGDLGWALCDPNPAVYFDCFDRNGNPASIEVFGGTSESSPLTAGEAALVIQAYRQSHGNADPSPALVKAIIKSTATDLGVPAYEQGAGLINAYKAVLEAMSIHDSNGNPTPKGAGLLIVPTQLRATDLPNTPEVFGVQVTNTGSSALTVSPNVQALGAASSIVSTTLNLNPLNAPTFVDGFGSLRGYVEQDFTVPAGAQRLDAAVGWNITGQASSSPVRLTLFDPQGRFAAFSNPQDQGAPFPNSGYGHVDVRFPSAGTWRAIIWSRASASGFNGPVNLSVSTSNFTTVGAIVPASLQLQPGQSGTFSVQLKTPAKPGDVNLRLAFPAVDKQGNAHTGGAVPIVLRSLIPVGATGGAFSGVLTGGNGRFGSPGQTLTYQFDVPAGLKDLEINTAIANNGYNLEGVLVDPSGLPIDVQSTATALDPSTGLPGTFTNTLQFFRRDPRAGRWEFVFFINDTSGGPTSLPFSANIAFNGARVSSTGVPNNPSIMLKKGTPVTAQITITNTGNTTKDYFVDPRLSQFGTYSFSGGTDQLPFSSSLFPPVFTIPPESSNLTIVATSMNPTMPINMDIYNQNGAGPYGGTGTPDIQATLSQDAQTGNYVATASSTAPEVVPGLWGAGPTEVGPYSDNVPTTTVQLGATTTTQQFDAAVTSSTGNAWGILTGIAPGSYAPLTLAPGASGTIVVTITPNASIGSTVTGHLYVDTLAIDPTFGVPITGIGDEVVAVPYAYTVGS